MQIPFEETKYKRKYTQALIFINVAQNLKTNCQKYMTIGAGWQECGWLLFFFSEL